VPGRDRHTGAGKKAAIRGSARDVLRLGGRGHVHRRHVAPPPPDRSFSGPARGRAAGGHRGTDGPGSDERHDRSVEPAPSRSGRRCCKRRHLPRSRAPAGRLLPVPIGREPPGQVTRRRRGVQVREDQRLVVERARRDALAVRRDEGGRALLHRQGEVQARRLNDTGRRFPPARGAAGGAPSTPRRARSTPPTTRRACVRWSPRPPP